MATLAQNRFQDDIHPLLRHPKPIAIDYAKAHRMLDLVTHDGEKASELQREKSFTTRWLERPLHEQALGESYGKSVEEHSEPSLNRDSAWEEGPGGRTTGLPHRQVHQDQLPFINSDVSPTVRQKPTLNLQRRRPVSMQPNPPIIEKRRLAPNSSGESDTQSARADTWTSRPWVDTARPRPGRPASYQPQRFILLEKPMANESRPRPTSLAMYPRQRNRSGSKIASSRGLRNNSDPNFSRPVSGVVTRPIPGEQLENDPVRHRRADDHAGHTSPASPLHTTSRGDDSSELKDKAERKSRNRWSTIPDTFKKFTWRRSSTAAQETPDMAVKIEALRRVNFTEDNLQWYENSTPITPKSQISTHDLLPTPVYSPFDVKNPFFESTLPLPFAPWADGPPSPATSLDKRRGSESSPLSSTRKPVPSGLLIDPTPGVRPISIHSDRNSVVMVSPIDPSAPLRHSIIDAPISPCIATPHTGTSRRGTPALERTCLLCKIPKLPTDFIEGRVSSNCWHEPATCAECLRSWVYTCFDTQGPDRCTCPECGEIMTREDVDAFADAATFFRR